MKRGKYYTINVYPESQDGLFTVVLLSNEGYRIPCSKHQEEPACKICDRMHKASVVKVRFDTPIKGGFKDPEDLIRAIYRAWIGGHHSKREAMDYEHFRNQ